MNVMNFATRNVITLLPGDSIDKAIDAMERHAIHHIVAAVEQCPVGIVSDRDILIATGWMLSSERRAPDRGFGGPVVGPTRIEQIMSRPIRLLSERATAQDAATAMTRLKIGALPVVSGQSLIGIVTETDLSRWLLELAVKGTRAGQLLDREVRQLMRTPVISVAPDAPLAGVIELFQRFRLRHVPVAVDDRLCGIISDRDVRRALGWASVRDMQAEARGRLSEEEAPSTAAEIMHEQTWTTESSTRLREALRRMLEEHVHSLPVVDDGELAGMITQTDFVRAVARGDLL